MKLIHSLMDVELYVLVVPMAPLEEVHASSVQHPKFPHMRWLLNTRRVPVLPKVARDAQPPRGVAERVPRGAAEDTRPTCAGVGDTDKVAWLCHECAGHLCNRRPKMPPQALANWNW